MDQLGPSPAWEAVTSKAKGKGHFAALEKEVLWSLHFQGHSQTLTASHHTERCFLITPKYLALLVLSLN